jgi:coenzyme F420-reducing hydrogenase alpha subunit
MHDLSIESEYVTRVEGHGHIKIKVADNEIKELRFEVPEAPRFFEVMLRGRNHWEASLIASRICGICAVAHTSASLLATEAALDITPSEQTVLLRKLNLDGEMIQSHVLHIYFLAAPDFLGVKSVVPLAETHPEVVKRAIRMRKLANDLCCTIGGRHVHPISAVPNGFTKLPAIEDLLAYKAQLQQSFEDLTASVELIKGVTLPDFEHPAEYICLTHPDEYAVYSGDILSSVDGITPLPEYKKKIKEEVVPYSTAKHAKGAQGSFMVGALARFNNNYDKLKPQAKEVAEAVGLKHPCHNPFAITVAQLVETVHFTVNAIETIDQLAERGIREEDRNYEVQAGQGVGAVEAPRGTLYHDYTYNKVGDITAANCIIPTAQNLANIESDMRALLPRLWDKPKEEITLLLEMLVRAYDPCISCSTHMLEVEFA